MGAQERAVARQQRGQLPRVFEEQVGAVGLPLGQQAQGGGIPRDEEAPRLKAEGLLPEQGGRAPPAEVEQQDRVPREGERRARLQPPALCRKHAGKARGGAQPEGTASRPDLIDRRHQ